MANSGGGGRSATRAVTSPSCGARSTSACSACRPDHAVLVDGVYRSQTRTHGAFVGFILGLATSRPTSPRAACPPKCGPESAIPSCEMKRSTRGPPSDAMRTATAADGTRLHAARHVFAAEVSLMAGRVSDRDCARPSTRSRLSRTRRGRSRTFAKARGRAAPLRSRQAPPRSRHAVGAVTQDCVRGHQPINTFTPHEGAVRGLTRSERNTPREPCRQASPAPGAG